MSTDYRPRGGGEGGGRSSSGGSSGGGGRRRRGGRGRSGSGHSHSGEHRSHSHSNGTTSAAPKKKEGFISKLLGIFKGKKAADKPEYKSTPRPSAPRTEFKERTPGAERTERAERPRREDRPERAPKVEPTPQEIVSPKLYVGNLAYEAAESDLFDLFSKVGHVKNVEVAMDRRAGRSKGFGFVEMETIETAKAAAEKLNRTDFMGRQIVVSGAKIDKRPIQSSQEEASPTDADSTSHEAGGSSESTI